MWQGIIIVLALVFGVAHECYWIWKDSHATEAATVEVWKSVVKTSQYIVKMPLGNGTEMDVYGPARVYKDWEKQDSFDTDNFNHVLLGKRMVGNRYAAIRAIDDATDTLYQINLLEEGTAYNFWHWIRVHGTLYAVTRSFCNIFIHPVVLVLLPVWFVFPGPVNGIITSLGMLREMVILFVIMVEFWIALMWQIFSIKLPQ